MKLADVTSKFTISKELTHQESPQIQILKWIDSHAEKCRNTTITNLARMIALDKDSALPRMSTYELIQRIGRLRQQGLIIIHGTRLSKDIVVNHGHPNMPPEIDEGIIKTTPSSDADLSVPQIIAQYVLNHPDKCNKIRNIDLAKNIIDYYQLNSTPASISTEISRMLRDGKIIKIPTQSDPTRFSFTIPAQKNRTGTLLSLICSFIADNEPNDITVEQLAQQIAATSDSDIKITSIIAQIGRLHREGIICQRPTQKPAHYDFRISDLFSKTPEEEDIAQNDLESPINEPTQESAPEEQSQLSSTPDKIENTVRKDITLPAGGVINLTINIRIGGPDDTQN